MGNGNTGNSYGALFRLKMRKAVKHHYGALPEWIGSVRRGGVQTVLGHLKKTKSMKYVIAKKAVDYAPGASYTSRRLLVTALTTAFLEKRKYMICSQSIRSVKSVVSRMNVLRRRVWKAEMLKNLKRRDEREAE